MCLLAVCKRRAIDITALFCVEHHVCALWMILLLSECTYGSMGWGSLCSICAPYLSCGTLVWVILCWYNFPMHALLPD
jgi:hypothetical protein